MITANEYKSRIKAALLRESWNTPANRQRRARELRYSNANNMPEMAQGSLFGGCPTLEPSTTSEMARKRKFRLKQEVPTEKEEHKALLVWLRARGLTYFHSPQEGIREIRYVSVLKSLGWTSGFPDILLINLAPSNNKPTVIELKRQKGGVLSESQRQFRAIFEKCGWNYILALGSDDAIRQLQGLGY